MKTPPLIWPGGFTLRVIDEPVFCLVSVLLRRSECTRVPYEFSACSSLRLAPLSRIAWSTSTSGFGCHQAIRSLATASELFSPTPLTWARPTKRATRQSRYLSFPDSPKWSSQTLRRACRRSGHKGRLFRANHGLCTRRVFWQSSLMWWLFQTKQQICRWISRCSPPCGSRCGFSTVPGRSRSSRAPRYSDFSQSGCKMLPDELTGVR